MGYLVKEALKTMCGNQWSYAVYWKIGCQNPKLLIWEDYYCIVMPYSALPGNSKSGNEELTLEELEKCCLSPEAHAKQFGAHEGEQVHLLVNRMRMASQVHVVGEGLVGRAAFTGEHQWIVSGNFNGMVHLPEAVNEVYLQFSAGMQTVAVIPVIPHGVIQLGSSLGIIENAGFIQGVKSLILQVEHVPRAPLLDNYMKDESVDNYMKDETVEEFALPFNQIKSGSLDTYGNMKNFICSNAYAGDTQASLFQDSKMANQTSNSLPSKIQDHLKPTASAFDMHNPIMSISHGYQCKPSTIAKVDSSHAQKGLLRNKVVGAELIPLAQDVLLLKRKTPSYDLDSGSNQGQVVANGCSPELQKKHIMLDVTSQHCAEAKSAASSSLVQSQLHTCQYQCMKPYDGWMSARTGFQIDNCSDKLVDSFSDLIDQPVANNVLSGCSFPGDSPDKHRERDLCKGLNIAMSKDKDHMPSVEIVPRFNKTHDGSDVPSCMTSLSGIQSSAGDDLFDALGVVFKNKILEGYVCNLGKNGTNMINQMKEKSGDLTSFPFSEFDRMSESGMFLASDSDQLLDAVVSGIHSSAAHTASDNLSCKSTLTKGCSVSVPSISPTFGPFSISQIHELFEHSKPFMPSVDNGATSSSCASGNGAGNCAQTSTFNGSNISSCVEKGPTRKHGNTIATANSKKSNLAGKPTHKRLKAGEKPRPRPKDRQMIQDRLTELREIIPNGTKYSIDALLERTVNHMLFLQSVTKHADKLKRTMESKIVDKDGELLIKDDFQGGATWAYELGSQARICPVVVEDLNHPRQLLVEMLCGNRGFFLEIADIIRGLGLNIIKGVMQTQKEKIWARFTVEANRDVTRMEIFLSLVHLLPEVEEQQPCSKQWP